MGILKNILIPASAIFILGVLLVMNLLKSSPSVSPLPETPDTIILPQEETEQAPVFNSDTAPTPQILPPTTKPQTLPKIASPKTSEIKTLQTIITPKPVPLAPMPPAILPLPLEIPALIPMPPPTPVETPPASTPTSPAVPPINEDDLMRSVVRIRCGNIFGSGFSVNPKGLILSVAHVVIDAVEKGVETCDVIFPAKHPSFGFFSEAHYRKGIILLPQETKKLYKEQALDVAALQTSFLENDPVFPKEFPFINYPFCGPNTLKDKILLFGYAANLLTNDIGRAHV